MEYPWGTPLRTFCISFLLVIYINDLPEKIDNIAKLFADDSKIILVINGLMVFEKLQKDLDGVGNGVGLGV